MSSAHGAQAGALAAALVRAGQKLGSNPAADESMPATGADAAAALAKLRSVDPSLPAVKPDAAAKLLRFVHRDLLQRSLHSGEIDAAIL